MIKNYEVLEPFLNYEKGQVIPIDTSNPTNILILSLIRLSYLKEIEEFPEWLRDMDKFVEHLAGKYQIELLFARGKGLKERKKQLILSQWLPEFAEWYNGGDSKWGYCIRYSEVYDRFTAGYAQEFSHGRLVGAMLFKNDNFLKLFIDSAPQEVKDYLKGER